MPVCYLGVGSNLGNRRANLRLALQKINQIKEVRIIRSSEIIETKPVGGPPGQKMFLNACLKVKTSLSPVVLLNKLKKIERELGRPARHRRWGPRTIDLDILLYGDKVVDRKDLKIPHPRLLERDFVIRPLLEIL